MWQDSFLPHIFSQVFHKVTRTESMQYIIRWHNIIIQYPRLYQTSIDLTLTHFQHLSKLTDAIGYKFKCIGIHNKIILTISDMMLRAQN